MTFDPTTDRCRRQSLSTFHIVALACDLGDVREGAAYLARHGISIDVARRVLLRPGQRRREKA